METYTLKTTKKDYKNGKISKEESELINAFIKARDKYHLEQDKMGDYYKSKFSDKINSSTNKDTLKAIKEELRTMPESVSKVLLFRHIILKENELSLAV